MDCSERLKHDTFKAHQHTEKLLIGKLKTIYSAEDYAHVLKVFYGFFHPVESQISRYIDNSLLPDFHSRGISFRIKDDLSALNNKSPIPLCSDLPRIENVLQACGALYVIEGSTLGGQVIARMLKENSHFKITDETLSFFRGYDENTIPMWRAFQMFLNNSFQTPEQITEVTNAAVETFEKMGAWIVKYETDILLSEGSQMTIIPE